MRPNRASHARGIGSSLVIVPTAVPSAMYAPEGLDSVTVIVSLSSSRSPSMTLTLKTFVVWPGAKVLVLLFAS